MGMLGGHSQGSCRAHTIHSHDYVLHRRQPPADRLASCLHVHVVLEPCSFLSRAITSAVSVAMFPRHVTAEDGVTARARS